MVTRSTYWNKEERLQNIRTLLFLYLLSLHTFLYFSHLYFSTCIFVHFHICIFLYFHIFIIIYFRVFIHLCFSYFYFYFNFSMICVSDHLLLQCMHGIFLCLYIVLLTLTSVWWEEGDAYSMASAWSHGLENIEQTYPEIYSSSLTKMF